MLLFVVIKICGSLRQPSGPSGCGVGAAVQVAAAARRGCNNGYKREMHGVDGREHITRCATAIGGRPSTMFGHVVTDCKIPAGIGSAELDGYLTQKNLYIKQQKLINRHWFDNIYKPSTNLKIYMPFEHARFLHYCIQFRCMSHTLYG